MKKILLLVPVLFSGISLNAQSVDPRAESIVTPQFFIAVLAGVLLALGFQFILTALSVALGISAIGDIKKKYVKGKNHFESDEDDSDSMSTGTMITTGFGLWSCITVGLSLFGATALAINLSLISSTVISITLGLVIWATFFILLFYLESKVVNTLIGGLINTATAGLRASASAVKDMFTPSKEQQIEHIADHTIEKIRKDFQSSFDPHIIKDSLDEFLNKVNKAVPDYDTLKQDLTDIVENSTHERSKAGKNSPVKWMAIQQVLSNAISTVSNGEAQNKTKQEQLQQLQKELREAYEEGDDNQERIENAITKLTDAEEQEVHSYIEKFKDILAKAKPDDVKQDKWKEQFHEIIKNPKVEANKLANELKKIDKDTVLSFVEANTAFKKEQLESLAGTAMNTFHSAADKLTSSVEDKTDMSAEELKKKLQIEVFKFINHTGRSDIDLSMLTSFFQNKLDDSKESLQSLKQKLKKVDKETLLNVVTSHSSLEKGDIDKVAASIDQAKNNVLQKIEDIELEANRRIENVKRKAVIQAENTRKNAAAAAWWLVISALVSAGAAIGGSLLAMG